jgi:hypothetical protein
MDIIATTHTANVGDTENQQSYYILQGAKQGVITTLTACLLSIAAVDLVMMIWGLL